MPPKPRKIDQHEWDLYKDAIKAFYANNTLPEVVERMKEEYDFSARSGVLQFLSASISRSILTDEIVFSKSQYEAQLKLWGIRKNLTRKEWETRLLHTDGQMPSTLTTSSGRVKDRKMIQRAKRYINQTPTIGSAHSTRPSQAAISTASPAILARGPRPDMIGQQYLTSQPPSTPAFDDPLSGSFFDQENVNTLPNVQISIRSRSPNSFEGTSGWSIEGETSGLPSMTGVQRLASPMSAFLEMSFTTIADSQLTTSQLHSESWSPRFDGICDLGWFNVDECSPEFSHSWASNTSILSHLGPSVETGVAFQSSSVTGLGSTSTVREFSIGFRNDWFQNLPSTKFEAFLSAQGEALTSRSNDAFKPFLSGSLTLLSVFNILSKSSDTTAGQFKDVEAAFRRLGALIPSTTGAMITEQQITDMKIIKMIFFSMINGLAGMDGIPIESLLLCLRRFEVFKPSFEQLLLGPPCPAKRCFIDNLLKAAIAAEDVEMVEIILKHHLIDVNNTICFDWVERYTPVERAASLHALGIIRILVKYGADVNKTCVDRKGRYGGRSYRLKDVRGALEHLLESYDSECSEPSLELVNTVRFLIATGSKVRIEKLNEMAAQVGIDEVASLLYHAVPQADHRAFFDWEGLEGYGAVIRAARLDHAVISHSIIKHMVEVCQSHGGSCLAEFAYNIEEAAVEAAIRGRIETVELLIDYAGSRDRILSAAIISRDPDLIQFLIDGEISFNPPARSVGLDDRSHRLDDRSHPTTPFAEAIRTGNSELISFLESKGCGTFPSLTTDGRLKAAIWGAVRGANIFYLRSFLSIASHSKVKFRVPSSVVELAVDRGHEEVTQLLVEQGAALDLSVLAAALEQRNQRLVPIVLATDLSDRTHNGYRNLTEALLRWAEPSVLQSILYTMPDIHIPGDIHKSTMADFCSHCIGTDNVDLFRLFIESTSDPKEWNGCLAMAVRMGHRRMASYLLKKGANPSNPSVLEAAIQDRPEMLSWLFGGATFHAQQARSLQNCVGASLLHSLISEDTESVEASVLDQLLEVEAINLIVPEIIESQPYELDSCVTPLGLAILGIPGRCNTNLSVIDKLLKAGADPNGLAKLERNPYRCVTALMAAIETGREDVVKLMIDQKADVNLPPRLSLRRTPLQYAAELGNLEMIRLLLEKSADINSPPAFQGGGTALQFAAISGNCNIVAELLEHGASLDTPPSKVDGRWPLEGAAEHGRLDMIQLLWNVRNHSPGNIGFEMRQCLRAMDFAGQNQHFGCQDLISELSGLSVELLDTEDYGVPWLAY